MPFEQIVGLVGVVTGGILGYLASYLNNRQQEKWKLENEYRTWKRTSITDDYKKITPLIQNFTELAHLYIEYHEDISNYLAEHLLIEKRKDIIRFMKEDLTAFPISLKHSVMEKTLNDLDKTTDEIEQIGIVTTQGGKMEEMSNLLIKMRNIEKRLHDNYQEMINDTFK